MKRIGILTFHRSLNYGAFMQAYSLYNRLRSDFPHAEVEIIDYTSRRIQNKYSVKPFVFIFSSLPELNKSTVIPTTKAVLKNAICVFNNKKFLENRKCMREAFDSNLAHMQLSDCSLCTDDFYKAAEYIDEKYDIVVVGSDCVWEFNNYPFPNIYFLKDAKKVHKLSYAACAQGIYYEKLTEFQKKYLQESWSKFDYLGVRDAATERLLTSVDAALEVHHNCDPTVFLDIESIPVDMVKLKAKFEAAGVDFTKPVICLMGNEYVGKVCREALGDQYQIIAVYEENKYADSFIGDLTPFEWAKCFSLFRLVFTNRFHGTLLALKNGVHPITFDYTAQNTNYTKDGMTKIRDLYDRLDLSEHYFVGKNQYTREEVEEIRGKAQRFLEADNRDALYRALNIEAQSFNSFSERLQEIVNLIS